MIKSFTRLLSLMMVAGLLLFSFKANALSGSYTIGGSGANYSTFADAVADLAANGVTGAVTFTVAAGTYNEKVSISAISGASSTNTITFDGVDLKTRKITYSGTSTGDRAVIVFDGCSYVTFKNFTIESTGSGGNCMNVYLAPYSTYNKVTKCDLLLPTNAGYTTINVCASSSQASYTGRGAGIAYNEISYCYMNNGYFAVCFYGNTYSSGTYDCVGNKINYNIFDKIYYYGFYWYYQGQYEIIGNKLYNTWISTTAYAIMSYYGSEGKVNDNDIQATYMGIYSYYENYYTTSKKTEYHNNMISGFTYSYNYGMYIYYAYNPEIYHNSVWVSMAGYGLYSYCYYPKIKNNIFVNTGTAYAMYLYYYAINSGDVDYNNYYSTGSSFVYFNNTYGNLSSLKSGNSAHNQNSISESPHFTNYSNLHYSTGTTPKFGPYMSAVPYDIDKDARGTTTTMLGADENIFAPYDLDILSITAPIVPTVGSNSIKISLVNAGANPISPQSLTVSYQIDGGTWIDETFTISSTWQPFTAAQNFTFSTPWIIPIAGTYDLCVRIKKSITSDPDATDQMCYSACTGLKGNYTIDAAGGGNFTDIQPAINSIIQCGISGPVNFTVKAGTYSRFTIPEIKGTSAINTITFTGVDKSKVIIQHAGGTTYNAVDKANIAFSGADYIFIENMTLNNTGSNYAEGIHLCKKSDYNVFKNIDIYMSANNSSYIIPIVGSADLGNYSSQGDWGNYNLFTNIITDKGYWAVISYGGGHNTYDHIVSTNMYYYGYYLYYAVYTKIQYCKISKFAQTGGYGIMHYYGKGDTIIGNYIEPGQYGYYSYYGNQGTSEHTLVANNTITNFQNPTYQVGLYIYYYCYNYHVVNNAVWVNGTYNSYSYAALFTYYNYYCEYKNNILISTGSTMVASHYYANYCTSDYNIYNHGSNTTYYFSYNSTSYIYNNWKAYVNTSYLGVHDQNSLWQADPQIISYLDFHLVKGSLGILGAAVPGNKYDMDGDPRCQLVSFIGPDEPLWKTAINDFISDDTMCRYSPITFYNTGVETDPHITAWYLNGTYVTNDFHYTQAFQNNGLNEVKLVQQTCAGTDTIKKKILIDDPKTAPKADFMSTKNVVEIGELVYLNDLSIDCPVGWKWEISPATVFDPFTKQNEPSFTLLNGTTLTSSRPSLKFNYSGSYDVSLTVDNPKGAGTKLVKAGYINVKFSDVLCGTQNETNSLYGVLYDNGGTGNYTAYVKKCTYLLKPCAAQVKLIFSELNLADGTYLRLYDGGSERGIPLWDAAYGKKGITGSMSNKLFDTTYYATKSGMIYVEFESDVAVSSGFKFEWQSIGKGSYTKPVAKFISEDTGCIVTPFNYENVSFADPAFTSYKWDYDGNSTIDATSIHGSFVTSFPGLAAMYKTTLTAENCGGVDTFSKYIVLINPQSAPYGDFSADVTAPVMDQDIATFSVNGYRLSCIDKTEWRITPSTWYFENGTNKYSVHPQVVFQDTGCYDVSVIMGNSNSSLTITKTKTCYIRPKQYCIPTVLTLHSDMGISRVRVADIDHSSEIGVTGYSSFVNVAQTNLIMGQTYDITVDRKSNFNKIGIGVWIDYNKDGDFYDAGELVTYTNSSSGASWKGSFYVPTSVALGASVIRVGVNYAGYSNDACGPNNFGEVEDYRVFISPDNVPPVITINGNNPYFIEQGYTYTDDGAIAVDNIMGNITSYSHHGVPLFTTSGSVDTKVLGSYYITYNACDTIPNCTADARRQVTVTPDKTPPVITMMGGNPLYVNVNVPFVDTFFTAYDLADGDITSKVQVTGNLNVYQLGNYSRTYTVTDKAGLKDVKTRTLVVQDFAAPDITLIGDNPTYVEIMTPYTELGATYSDNYWPNNKISYNVSGIVDTTKSGSYTISYAVSDYSGNGPNIITRTVIVWDSLSPMISAKGGDVIEHEVNTPFVDPGLEIKDNSYSGFTTERWGSFLSNFPDETPTKIGNFIIFYKVTDASGNVSETFGRVVKVIDSHAPVLTLLGSPYVIYERWETPIEDGYSVTDNYYKAADLTIDTVNNVTTMIEGLYHVCYTATDPSGNVSNSVCRLVRVIYENTGISESNSEGVSVYPNPSSGLFIAETSSLKGQEVSISVLNQIGQEVMVIHRGMIDQDQFEIDLSKYADGVYLLRVQTPDNSYTKQMILTK